MGSEKIDSWGDNLISCEKFSGACLGGFLFSLHVFLGCFFSLRPFRVPMVANLLLLHDAIRLRGVFSLILFNVLYFRQAIALTVLHTWVQRQTHPYSTMGRPKKPCSQPLLRPNRYA